MSLEPKVEALNNELKKLEKISDILGSAIVNRNGMLITSRLPRDIEERKFGAMAATMFGAIETATSSLGNNKINNITVEFNHCQLIALPANEELIIVSLIDLDVNLGLILIEIEETIKKITEIM